MATTRADLPPDKVARLVDRKAYGTAAELADISERLARVIIENLGYGAFIERYDRPETLYYRKR